MKLSACIDALYAGVPLPDAVRDVQAQGLDTIEFWSWRDKDIDFLEACVREQGLKVAALCTDFVSLTEPDQRERYVSGLKDTVETAKRLACPVIISQVGSDTGEDRAAQRRSIADGLKACLPVLKGEPVTLAIEPLNLRVDHPGYFLSTAEECVQILEDVGDPQVRMLFDIYHQQITQGDILRRIGQYLPYIAHFHTAGNPGRHELYDSELNYAAVFRELRRLDYPGYVGLEYFPRDLSRGIAYAKSL